MAWARVESTHPFNSKILSLSDTAFRLHIAAICVATQEMTDGRLSSDQVETILMSVKRRRGAKQAWQELIDKGLLDVDSNGVTVHDYLDYNDSRDKILRNKALSKDRQDRFRKKGSNAVTNAVGNALAGSVTTDVHSTPLHSTRDGGGREADQASDSLPPQACGQCVEFGTRIGWNPTTKKPCNCPLGLWRLREKKRTGNWPVGPEEPAREGTGAAGRKPAGSGKLSPEMQAELDALLDQLGGDDLGDTAENAAVSGEAPPL